VTGQASGWPRPGLGGTGRVADELYLIGHQGHGIGSLLLAHHAALDHAGTPAYLEAATVRTRRLYSQYGYILRSDAPIRLPGGGPPCGPCGENRTRTPQTGQLSSLTNEHRHPAIAAQDGPQHRISVFLCPDHEKPSPLAASTGRSQPLQHGWTGNRALTPQHW
jgi:hypothetical protein